MTSGYPVVTHDLPQARTVKKGWFGSEQVRDLSSVPPSGPNHRRVFSVGHDFVLDTGDQETVLAATQVALVDVSRDVPVRVALPIPARDAGSFEIRVTFVCTVDDPVQVVRAGLTDLPSALDGYLRRHPRIFELGLDFDLADINPARRRITAQLTAYTIASPPPHRGVSIELASVEIPTPAPVENLVSTLRDKEGEHTIAWTEQRHRHGLAALSQQNGFELDRKLQEYQRETYERNRDVGNDARSALKAALAAREITAREYADILQRMEADEQQAIRAAEDRRFDQQSLAESRRWESERVDQDQRWISRHKNTEISAKERIQRTDHQFDVIRKLADRGVFDPHDADQILRGALTPDQTPRPESTRESKRAWSAVDRAALDESDGIDDQMVREEDDD